MRESISLLYPRKASYVPPDELETLIREGQEQERKYGIAPGRGGGLIVLLMLTFGHGCTDDPLYPWIGRTLRDPEITSPEARAERLKTESLTWLEQMLAYFEKGGTT
jgi:hypothetical protein